MPSGPRKMGHINIDNKDTREFFFFFFFWIEVATKNRARLTSIDDTYVQAVAHKGFLKSNKSQGRNCVVFPFRNVSLSKSYDCKWNIPHVLNKRL